MTPADASSIITAMAKNPARRRLRFGNPKNRTAASRVPGNPKRSGSLSAVVPAVVVTVRVAVAAAVPAIVTFAGTPQVGGSVGFASAVVTAQERFTCPVNPPDGVTVRLAVFPVDAPGVTVIAPLLLRLNPADATTPVTVTFTMVVAVILPVVASTPVTVAA